jgi:FkbM family methyltransferase
MGALDGVMYSNTFSLEKELGWRGVLLEADPEHFHRLVQNRPESILVQAAVCDRKRTVHYVNSGNKATRGIREFMAPAFVQKWHGQKRRRVETRILCMPLSDILAQIPIRRFDFFALDLEGAELAALSSIDFRNVSFGVLVVEADGRNKTKDCAIQQMLTQKGYRPEGSLKRNDWYVTNDLMLGPGRNTSLASRPRTSCADPDSVGMKSPAESTGKKGRSGEGKRKMNKGKKGGMCVCVCVTVCVCERARVRVFERAHMRVLSLTLRPQARVFLRTCFHDTSVYVMILWYSLLQFFQGFQACIGVPPPPKSPQHHDLQPPPHTDFSTSGSEYSGSRSS